MIQALVLLGVLLAAPALAVEPAERLADPALEARARAISAELRCLVCQNESIDESHADLARDIRRLVRERLFAGDTDPQATQAVVSRYGDFVLLRPPMKAATVVLWFGPFVLLACAALTTGWWLRRRSRTLTDAAPLPAEERERLNRLTREGAP